MASKLYGGARLAYMRARRGTDRYDISRVEHGGVTERDLIEQNPFLATYEELIDIITSGTDDFHTVFQAGMERRRRERESPRYKDYYWEVQAQIAVELVSTELGTLSTRQRNYVIQRAGELGEILYAQGADTDQRMTFGERWADEIEFIRQMER